MTLPMALAVLLALARTLSRLEARWLRIEGCRAMAAECLWVMAAKVRRVRGAAGAARACCTVIGVRGAIGERGALSDLTGNAPDIMGTARDSVDAMGRNPPKTVAVEARVGAIEDESSCDWCELES